MLDRSSLLQSSFFQVVASLMAGAVVFVLANWIVPGGAALVRDRMAPSPTPSVERANSIAARIPAGNVAISTPIFAAQSLFSEVQSGDRMDIIALLPPGG